MTITLIKEKLMIMCSNVPPAQLKLFMKTIYVKQALLTNTDLNLKNNQIIEQKTLKNESLFSKVFLSNISYEKISPLTNEEFKKVLF